jgi:ATP/ADP translocase
VIAYINFYWELSNRVFSVEDAKVTYPKYFIIGQSNLLISGAIIIASTFFEPQSIGEEKTAANELIIFVIICCFFIIERLYSSLSRQVTTSPTHKIPNKLLFRDIWKESFFKLMFLGIIFYYTIICIVEILCIHYLRLLFHSTNELMFIHGVSIVSLGVLTVLLSYVSKRVLHVLDILIVLRILPLFLLIFGSFAFISMFYKIEPKYSLLMFLFTFIFGRGIKYTLYDSAKEIATIPFRIDKKSLGKILDMLGVGTGRFIAHLFPVILFTVFPRANYDNISGVVIIPYLTIVILFYVVSDRLGKFVSSA